MRSLVFPEFLRAPRKTSFVAAFRSSSFSHPSSSPFLPLPRANSFPVPFHCSVPPLPPLTVSHPKHRPRKKKRKRGGEPFHCWRQPPFRAAHCAEESTEPDSYVFLGRKGEREERESIGGEWQSNHREWCIFRVTFNLGARICTA